MRRRQYVLVMGLSILVLGGVVLARQQPSGVATNIDLPDIHFFSDPDCMVACWQGLRPGKTTTTQVIDYFHKTMSANVKASSYGAYALYSAPYQWPVFLNAVVSSTHLVSLQLSGSSNLNLEKVIKAQGSPPYVRMSYSSAPDRSMELAVVLYYPQTGFIFSLRRGDGLSIERETSDSVRICLKPEAAIGLAWVVVPGSIDEMVADQWLPFANLSPQETQSTVVNLTSWPGFTCISRPWTEP